MADTNAIVAKARERLLQLRNEAAAKLAASEQQLRSNMLVPSNAADHHGWRLDRSRPWNEQQMAAILAGMQGKSFCLIGAAGTGKTSTLKGLVNSLLDNSMLPIIRPYEETKWLYGGKPGIVLVSFTNMAVRQIAKHFSKDITCITIHKLLEFAPHFYEIDDPVTGELRKTVRFEPNRNKMNPLPRSLKTIVVDESSMVSVELINLVCEAMIHLPHVQWIFLGDLNQIPPVMGKAILGRKLLELPVVELTEVYRQALESPIITLATTIKDGKQVPVSDATIIDDRGAHGKVTIKTWSKPIAAHEAVNKAANFCKAAIQEGIFDPFQDIILVPHGKMLTNKGEESFSSGQINIRIADWLGRQRKAQVYEVVAGFETHYYAVGDKVLVNKREAIIEHIQWNRDYSGKRPLDSRKFDIDRWGGATKKQDPNVIDMYSDDEMVATMDVDAILASMVADNTVVEDRVYQASHRIRVRFINGEDITQWKPTDYEDEDTGWEGTTLSTAAEINDMLFGYAVTVHKSQGSEWRKVFLLCHQSHAAQCSRELIYTAITRAAKELLIICEPDRGMKVGTLSKAAKSPIIRGNTLAEKLQWLQEKQALEQSEEQE